MMWSDGLKWRPGLLPSHHHAAAWMTAIWIFALFPPLVEAIRYGGLPKLQLIGFSLALAVLWELIFAAATRRVPSAGFVTAGLIFGILAPVSSSYWQLALGASAAYAVAIHVFGGYGWTFLNHSVVAFAFLLFAFPGDGYGGLEFPSWQFVLPGMLLLLLFGVIPWLTLCAVGISFAFTHFALSQITMTPLTIGLQLLFPAVFLVCDPIVSPAMNTARIVYGAVVGGLTTILLISGRPLAEAVIPAALLASIFAPLFDHAALYFRFRTNEVRGD